MRIVPQKQLLRAVGSLAILSLAACSGGASSRPEDSSCLESGGQSVVVYAASSMNNVLSSVRDEYEKENPCVTSLTFSYGSSATLATQIVNGSPVDVFISASSSTMDTVRRGGRVVGEPFVFARNEGEIMMSSESDFKNDISGINDLFNLQPKIQVGVCVSSAPCGVLADKIFENAQVLYTNPNISRGKVDSEAASVEDLVSKIEMGELDAGIVYHSDCVWAKKMKDVECVSLPTFLQESPLNVSTAYVVAAISKTPQAKKFVQFISSDTFMSQLQTEFGFLAP